MEVTYSYRMISNTCTLYRNSTGNINDFEISFLAAEEIMGFFMWLPANSLGKPEIAAPNLSTHPDGNSIQTTTSASNGVSQKYGSSMECG